MDAGAARRRRDLAETISERAAAVPSASLQPILALFGQPVAGNPTQYAMEKAFARHELDWRYLTLEVAPSELADAMRGMRSMGFAGGNIAAPHQRPVSDMVDRLGETAALVGLVNAVFRDGPELIGEYTEGLALVDALRGVADPAGKQVLLVGPDPLARAVGIELVRARAGAIVVVAEDEREATDLVDLLHGDLKAEATSLAWQEPLAVPAEMEIVIHARRGPSDSDESPPLDLAALRPGSVVADMALVGPRSQLLEQAHQRGCALVDGVEVLVRRTAHELRRWTGVEPDATVLREAYEEFLLL